MRCDNLLTIALLGILNLPSLVLGVEQEYAPPANIELVPREVLKGDDLAKRLERMKKFMDDEKHYRSIVHRGGVEVTHVEFGRPDFDNDKLMGLGDVIIELDGHAIHTTGDWYRFRDDTKDQKIKYISVGDPRLIPIREVQISKDFPGKTMFRTHRVMQEPEPLCDWPRDPRWNVEAEIAFNCADIDPEVAESEFFGAVQKGFPKGFAYNLLLARCWLRESRLEQALPAAWLAWKEQPTHDKAVMTLQRVAWATDHVSLAYRCTNIPAYENEQSVQAVLRWMETQIAKPQQDASEKPLVAAHKLFWRDTFLTRKVMGENMNLPDEYERGFAKQVNGHVGYFNVFPAEIDGRDLYLRARIKYAMAEERQSEYVPSINIGFGDSGGPDANEFREEHTIHGLNGVRIIGRPAWGFAHNWSPISAIIANGRGWIGYEFSDRFELDSNRFFPEHDLEMAVYKGRLEIQMDGRPLYLGPIDTPAKKWAFVVNQSGRTMNFTKLEIFEILDRAEFENKLKPELEKPIGFYQCSPLADAIQRDFGEERINALLQLGASPNTPDKFKRTPVHLAIGYKPGLLPLLLKNGGKKDAWVMAVQGDVDGVRAAMLNDPKLLHSKDPFSLLHAAACAGQLEVARILINSGADVDAEEPSIAESPLHFSVRANQLEMAKFLMSQGAGLNKKNKIGVSPWETIGRQNTAMSKLFEEFNERIKKGEFKKPIKAPEDF